MKSISFVFILLTLTGLKAQTLSISAQDTVCRLDVVDFVNSSSGIDSVQWDFCPGDLQLAPLSESSYDIPASTSNLDEVDIVYDGVNYYGFILGLDNTLGRITIGDSLTDNPSSFTNFGTVGTISSPRRVSAIKEGTTWYLFIANLSNNSISRIDFGSDIGGSISSSLNLGNIGSELSQPFAIEALELNGSYYLLVGNHSAMAIKIFDYGNSFSNTPSLINTISAPTAMGRTTSIETVTLDGEIHLVVSGQSNGYVYSMGSSLSNTAVEIHDLGSLGPLSGPRDLDVIFDNGEIFINVISLSGNYYSYRFDENWNFIEYNDYGQIPEISDETRSIHFQQQHSAWTGFSINRSSNKELVLIRYPNNCSGTKTSSSEDDPTDVSYDSLGWSYYTVHGFADGFRYHLRDSLFVQGVDGVYFNSEYNCSNTNTNFIPVPILEGSNVVSYSWNFDDPGSGGGANTSSEANPTHIFTTPGDYNVFLEVTDDCSLTSDTTISVKIYDENDLTPDFEAESTTFCINSPYQFNDLSFAAEDFPQSWAWSVDGIVQSTDQNPMLTFSSEGNVTVRLVVTGLSGCDKIAEQVINISPGPTAGFTPSATSACEGDVISFTDTSSGDSQDYFWDFQNGFTSTASSPPAQLYENSGSYFVSLRTTDAQGCQNTFTQEISIAASPQISIDFDIPCTSPDGVQFYDLTTVEGADIVSWSWEVNGEEVSTEQNPTINFSSTGVKTVGLTVLSSNGCEQYASEDIEVLTAPSPDFSINLGCQGETTTFTDETSSVGNPIVSWLWTVDGTNYGTQDINHIFENPGSYDVTLEVTGQNFCSETITQTVEIIELPQVSFAVNGECDNQIIQVIDESTTSEDPVVSRRWMLDGANVGNGTELLLDEMEDGTYELGLELETEFGCVVNATQMLEINDAPESLFTSSRTYGIPGDQLTFTNTSTGGTSYQWLLDGALRSIESGSESITFPNPGEYIVGLVSENSLGCYDTTSQEILIAVPEVDLAIGSFELVNENNTGKIFMEIQNFSNLPVEITEAQLVLENEFRVSEQILEFIGVGESSLVSLNVGIPMTVSEPSYFCVKLISQYTAFDDINPVNNEKCLTIQPAVQVEDPFPNPVSDQFRLKVVVPDDGAATLRLINSAGKIHKENLFEATTGLNNFFVDMSTLNPGIYYVTVDVLGYTFKRKVIKL
ncbi:PKD domain-containing protein [Ekhidna sp.]|jgi:PKD repeat protein|uniref:PKD domain-containing protein n=1 Tax=Ekhidna sp. TaxID=2608089 RepID=UPI0032EDF241